jgi:hypothetical protein
MTQIDKIKKAYNLVNKDNLDFLDQFYSADILFVDPIGTHKGLRSVKAYYEKMYKNVQHINFDFSETVSEGSSHVLIWTMTVKAKSLNGGKPVTVQGNSHLRVNAEGQVCYHRDYFDMGEMFYEKIPVLKWFVGTFKRVMKA